MARPLRVLLISVGLLVATVAGCGAFVSSPAGLGRGVVSRGPSAAAFGGAAAAAAAAPGLSTYTALRASKKDEVDFPDRLLSVVPYALPLLDGLDYGEGIFRLVPGTREAVYSVLGTSIAIWHDLPFASFVFFLIVTVLARNSNLPRFIRFNMQQAVLLDVGLIVVGLVEQLVKLISPGGAEPLDTFIFYCVAASCSYAVVQNLRGKQPTDIPVISEAASMQIGPF